MSTTLNKKFPVIWWLVLILLVAVALRLFHLGQESFWTDEAYSVHHAQLPALPEIQERVIETEAAPVGYYVLLHLWLQIIPASEFSVRLLSVLFSVAALIVFFSLVRLVSSKKVALLSTVLMAFSMTQVLYAQEARLYSLFTFLSLMTAYYFTKIYLQETASANEQQNISRKLPETSGNAKDSIRSALSLDYALYAFFMIVSLYTNYLSFFLILIYSMVLLWKKSQIHSPRLVVKRWLFAHMFVGLLSVPLLPVLLNQYTLLNEGFVSTLIRKGLPSFAAQLGLFVFVVPLLFFLGLLVAGMIYHQRVSSAFPRKNHLPKSALQRCIHSEYLFTLFLGGAGALYLLFVLQPFSLFGIPLVRVPLTHSYFLIRHSLFLAPLLYFCLGYKLSSCKNKTLFVTGLFILLLVNSIALTTYYTQPTKTQWKEAAAFIEEQNPGSDLFTNTAQGIDAATSSPLVLLDGGGFSNVFLLKWYAPPAHYLRLTWSNRYQEGRALKEISEEDFVRVLQSQQEFWLLLSKNRKPVDYYPELIEKHFSGKFMKNSEKTWQEITMVRYVAS